MKNLKRPQLQSEKGFTLVEILVAASIFVIVMTIATGAFVNIMKIQRRVNAKTEALQDLRQVTELIVRDIRTGQVSEVSLNELTVNNQEGEDITYSLSAGNEILRNSQPVTGDRLTVRRMEFTYNENIGLQQSPITIFVSGLGLEVAGPGTTEDEIHIQTSVTSR